MVVDDTVQHVSNREEHLGYDDNTHPIVCQIGGNSPDLCGAATSLVLEHYEYDECNLNIDCPSERVSGKREFGAILMKKTELAKDILRKMQSNVTYTSNNSKADDKSPSAKVSVKCRIGVDEWDDLEFAASFIRALEPTCRRFYLHARKCVLDGLMNARQNRSIPPLNYPRVYDLCRMFPDCEFWINGGIRTLQDAKRIAHGTTKRGAVEGTTACCNRESLHRVPCQLCNAPYGSCIEPPTVAPANLRGCMMGRAAVDDPCLFHDVDRYFYGEASNPCKNRREVLVQYCDYLERLYPRRCCDSDERITYEYPPPPGIINERDYCCICADVYGPVAAGETGLDGKGTSDWSGVATLTTDKEDEVACLEKKTIRGKPKPRIASRIIGRCLKPVQGLFLGIPNSRVFRRVCDNLGQDATIRNCGPGYILRKAMMAVPSDILDKEF